MVALEKKYQQPGQRIENDLQTNGTLLNDEWCAFLRKNKFLVGLSIDGPQELHDRYRVNKGGKPTFDKVFAAGQLLQKYRVPFNTLTVVNRINAKKPLDVYRFLSREFARGSCSSFPAWSPRYFTTPLRRNGIRLHCRYKDSSGRASGQSRLRCHGLVGRS